MSQSDETRGKRRDRSVFRSLFVPLFLLMVVQAVIFFVSALYGGIEDTLKQNATDILAERLINRKNEIETRFNNNWAELDDCSAHLQTLYEGYEALYGGNPLEGSADNQIRFLSESADMLIDTLRRNEVNGVFLILNSRIAPVGTATDAFPSFYGLCIRDMDPYSHYIGREDLLIERSPSSMVDELGCSLDSWWESKYTFANETDGAYFYQPLHAALENPGVDGDDLAYFAGAHRILDSDPEIVSLSIPLIDRDGFPYAVLGVEITVRHLTSLLPYTELNQNDKSCYVLALCDAGSADCQPIAGVGPLYNQCFTMGAPISIANRASTGGFVFHGRGDVALYGCNTTLKIYNTNNPFEARQLMLLAFVEQQTLFAFIGNIEMSLLFAVLVCLALGLVGILWVSRRFVRPITALAGRVRGMDSRPADSLGRIGLTEIDQLVEAIDALNRNASKNVARAEFFSRMSHDMRTPMNAIISFSSPELLQGATASAKDEYLEKIHASGEYLLGLINEVLDMTKIESDKTELRLEPIKAELLCAKTIPIIEMLARKKGVVFTSEQAIPDALYVIADEQHVNQIVMNLLSNAVKFTPADGNVSLSVHFDEDDGQKARCSIVVRDTGIGMSDAFAQRLYTPFAQEHAGREGTGLGLSIAKKLVDLMDGEIVCDSREGEGTTFTVRLPFERGTKDAMTPVRVLSTDDEAFDALKDHRVLVCEDNVINAQIILHLLVKRGVQVQLAANGSEGVKLYQASEPFSIHAVLMDIQMPVMDGLTAARAIRALPRPDAAKTPIIAMTANAFEQDEQASRDAGMNAHLTKPIEPRKLFETLRQFMG